MPTFREFLLTEAKIPQEVEERNKAIDIEELIKTSIKKKFPSATDDAIKEITEWMLPKKTFSLGKMTDAMSHPTGWMKAAIDAVNDAAKSKGFGKTSGMSKTQSQADRIDSYLKQKHVKK